MGRSLYSEVIWLLQWRIVRMFRLSLLECFRYFKGGILICTRCTGVCTGRRGHCQSTSAPGASCATNPLREVCQVAPSGIQDRVASTLWVSVGGECCFQLKPLQGFYSRQSYRLVSVMRGHLHSQWRHARLHSSYTGHARLRNMFASGLDGGHAVLP